MSVYVMLKLRRDDIYRLASRYGVTRIRIFGSVSYERESPSSDIDLLVDVDEDRSLLDLALLSNVLEDEFGRKIDIVTEPALHPRLRQQILKEAILL